MAAILAFLHFFLLIASYYIIKPVRDALFVKTIGPDKLPYFYLAVAAIVFLVVALYNALLRRYDSRRVVLALQLLVGLNIVAFWWLMQNGTLRLAAAFYVWASVYNVLLVTVFWSLTNDLFAPAEGRRLYGFIGGGGIVGGIVGSTLASVLPLLIGTVHCLGVAAALMFAAVVVTQLRIRLAPPRLASFASSESKSEEGNLWRDISLLFSDRHVLLIAKVVFFLTLAKTIFNFHYYKVVAASISGTDATTAFFGVTYTATNIASALLQFAVTTWVLRKWGAKWGLVFSPAVLLGAMVALLFPPVLLLAAAFSVGQQSTSYSINQSAKELLYTPCSEAIKYRTKAVIDMFVFRFGDAVASLLLLVLHSYLELPAAASLVLGAAGCAYWLTTVLRSDDPTRDLGPLPSVSEA